MLLIWRKTVNSEFHTPAVVVLLSNFRFWTDHEEIYIGLDLKLFEMVSTIPYIFYTLYLKHYNR